VFGATVNVIGPFAVPLLAVRLIHDAAVVAVQVQFVNTLKLPDSPAGLYVPAFESSEKLQTAAVWVTVKIWPAMLSVPVRALGDVFALTV
jgi:hypothetical protein